MWVKGIGGDLVNLALCCRIVNEISYFNQDGSMAEPAIRMVVAYLPSIPVSGVILLYGSREECGDYINGLLMQLQKSRGELGNT